MRHSEAVAASVVLLNGLVGLGEVSHARGELIGRIDVLAVFGDMVHVLELHHADLGSGSERESDSGAESFNLNIFY